MWWFLFSFGNTCPCTLFHFILFISLPLPVPAISPFCAFGLTTTNIKFHLISLELDWCSFHVFSCIFMLIPWNIPVLFCLPFSRSIFFYIICILIYLLSHALGFSFPSFQISVSFLPIYLSLPSRFSSSINTMPFSYPYSIPHLI